ncbi:MAG TPA: DUF1697 domain-containing protein [Chthoniobacterales bacterium]|nr:DUF1697 domain-containing protein [Chthoniobacterales bacterium]
MPRYVAFLRAINVGGRVVKMQGLQELFEQLGFREVETFIASGNVIFKSPAKTAASLEVKLERLLQRELGYEVKTFVRSDAELAEIAGQVPFGRASDSGDSTLYIGFLKTAPTSETCDRLLAAQTAVDAFRIVGRELYWLCRGRSSDSTFAGPKLEKTLRMPTTLRNSNTVLRISAKYPARV